jgi:hypothetical protein
LLYFCLLVFINTIYYIETLITAYKNMSLPWSWLYGIWIYYYLCNQYLSQSSKLDFRIYWSKNFKIRIFIYVHVHVDSIKKIGKSLIRINFHWPWANGTLLKSMTVITTKVMKHFSSHLEPEYRFSSRSLFKLSVHNSNWCIIKGYG